MHTIINGDYGKSLHHIEWGRPVPAVDVNGLVMMLMMVQFVLVFFLILFTRIILDNYDYGQQLTFTG